MMKMNLLLALAFFSVSATSFATEEAAKEVTFDGIKPHRENFKEKFIQIEGKVKDLKVIKEGGNKFATFFLSDGSNPEETISVKVNLSKKKTVINTFTCKDGDFTTVQGRFKPWGTASYLGKMDIREAYDFKCSETAQTKAAPVEVAKKKPAKKEAVEVAETKNPRPTLTKVSSSGTNTVTDSHGKAIKVGAVMEPGSVVKTGSNSAVQIQYPDGTKISVGANSKLTTQAGTPAVQAVALQFGRIHAMVHKKDSEELHFRVNTKTATMGVRGTQFFVDESKTGIVTTHVINGRVDVAKDDVTLVSGKGTHVYHDQFVEVEKNKISTAQAFKANEYLEKMKLDQPEMLAMADAPEENEIAPMAATPVAKVEAKHSEKSEWAVFRLGALGYFNKSTDAVFSGFVSWNPETHLVGNWKLGLDLGYTNVKILSTTSRASILEYALVGSFAFNSSISAEIKAGAQSWLSPASVTGGMGGLALKYSLCDQCVINHIIFGDDVISLNSVINNILRVGVGFRF